MIEQFYARFFKDNSHCKKSNYLNSFDNQLDGQSKEASEFYSRNTYGFKKLM